MNKRVPEVSVIVIDYHGQRFWERLLDSLGSQSYRDFEIIVVDNGGGLELPESVAGVPIQVEKTRNNIGFAAGCNAGARLARGSYLAFLNNDTTVEKDWLKGLLEPMDRDPMAGAVCSKILFASRYAELLLESPHFCPARASKGASSDGRDLGVRLRYARGWARSSGPLVQYGFHGPELVDGVEWRWTDGHACLWLPVEQKAGERVSLEIDTPAECQGGRLRVQLGSHCQELLIDGKRHTLSIEVQEDALFNVINSAGSELGESGFSRELGIYEKDIGHYDTPRSVGAFSACSVMIRKCVFEQLNGFDPAFFAYFEDTDLSWRMREAGWKILYDPNSVVFHLRSATSGIQSPFSCFHSHRNFRWNVAKNAKLSVSAPLLARELFSRIPRSVQTDETYDALRLKKETLCGMLRYMLKRFWLHGERKRKKE